MNMKDIKTVSIEDYIDLPSEVESIAKPKIEISKIVSQTCKQRNISIRELAKKVGLKHPQIIRITSGDANYNIDTLLKILDGLDLEISLKPKK